MPEATQFTWSFKELITLMLKEAGIHEGIWTILLNYGMSPGNFGPSPEHMSPGVIVGITSMGIHRLPADARLPPSLYVDAAEVNPISEAPQASRSRDARTKR
jgi:hypothetical protein